MKILHPGWSKFSLGAHVILLVLSCAGSYQTRFYWVCFWAVIINATLRTQIPVHVPCRSMKFHQANIIFLQSIQNVEDKTWERFTKFMVPIALFHKGRVKRICVFEHSVMTNFNCACPAIQRGQGSGFLSEGSSWLTACMSEQRRFWRDCSDAQARLNLRCSHRR